MTYFARLEEFEEGGYWDVIDLETKKFEAESKEDPNYLSAENVREWIDDDVVGPGEYRIIVYTVNEDGDRVDKDICYFDIEGEEIEEEEDEDSYHPWDDHYQGDGKEHSYYC